MEINSLSKSANMKKLIPFLMTAFLLLAFAPTQLSAGKYTGKVTVKESTTSSAVSSNPLLTRLAEIRAMDFSVLSSSERKSLRKELRSMKSQFSAIGGGVYISVGALILIIILIILLL